MENLPYHSETLFYVKNLDRMPDLNLRGILMKDGETIRPTWNSSKSRQSRFWPCRERAGIPEPSRGPIGALSIIKRPAIIDGMTDHGIQ